MRRRLTVVVLAAAATLILGACTQLEEGKPVSIFADPFRVAGMAATDGPSGLRSDAPAPILEVQGTDGGDIDQVAVQTVSDVEEYWKSNYNGPLKGKFVPIDAAISWDARGEDERFCGDATHGFVNAAYCFSNNTVGWDRGVLLPQVRDAYGDIAITAVFAHELGHALQRMADLVTPEDPSIVFEQQADCFAGVYMRWVAEGKSPRFTVSTGDGLNKVLATIIMVRDPPQSQRQYQQTLDREHGSAFERISAFQMGFTDGTQACAGINEDEIKERRGNLPVTFSQNDSGGEFPVDEHSVSVLVDALNLLFKPANPPTLSFDAAAAQSCSDGRESPPVSYCPGTNTIDVDLPALQKMGAPERNRDTALLATGDNTAYSVLTSRYMLALQKQRGVVLDNAQAALRTACLTGVATAKLTEPVSVSEKDTISLSAGDLDEAVSGMLTNGLAASDVNGDSVPSGFSRIDAFRTGVLGDEDRCFKRYP